MVLVEIRPEIASHEQSRKHVLGTEAWMEGKAE
jgi:hypothetical protein